MKPKNIQIIKITTIATVVLSLTACGTLTGIPAHGGGKRFATEQRLVSASIRSSLKDIDVSALRGKRVAVVFDIIADEGGGSMSGGRMNLLGAATSGYLMSPVTAANSAFQVFNLNDAGSNYSNSSNTGSNVANTTFITNSHNVGQQISNSASNGTNASVSNGNSTSTSNGNSTNQSTDVSTSQSANQSNGNNTSNQNSTGTNTNTATTTGNDAFGNINQTAISSGSNTQTTTTTGTDTSTGSQTSATNSISNGNSSNTQTNTENNSNTSTGNNSQASISTSNSNDTGVQNGNNDSKTTSTDKGTQTGGYSTQRQDVSNAPSYTRSQTKGNQKALTATLDYKGLGEYQNFAVPKSDASLLMGLTRNYLLLNGIFPTAPDDPNADALLYVSVDIFGIIRSRFDAYIYNQETLKAETSFEMMAFDRNGKMIMSPKSVNREAQYAERYLFWAGPFRTDERVNKGKGLLVDFSDVDGQHATYGKDEIKASYPFGKN